jgi:hypothetical protein
MAAVEDGIQAQIRNIEATYGKPLPAWFAIIVASGLSKHTDIVAMLKTVHGMSHGAAHRVSLLARQVAAPTANGADPADVLYAGRKAALRPVHDALIGAVSALGDDVEIAPKKGYLSLRRRKQFAMIQPSTTHRIDIGLILPGVTPDGRLEPAAGFNALFTHRVRIATAEDIDAQLLGWLQTAYRAAG